MVAVPIGNARDITLRALDTLASADLLAAEDTRSLRRLMAMHGVAVADRPVLAYHEHNGARVRPRLLQALDAGQSVAFAAEAGTPTLSDPGFDLVREARGAGHAVIAAPGASAALTALASAGLPTDRFLFAGFLPSARSARRKALEALAEVQATLVFYESPRRVGALLADAAEVLGGSREAAVCRELTKRFEEVRTGPLSDLAEGYSEPPKGEIVVLIDRERDADIREIDMESMVSEALKTMSVRDAADTVSRALGVKRRKVYQMAMAKAAERDDG